MECSHGFHEVSHCPVCTFCKSFGFSRGILVRKSELDLISSLSAQKPICEDRFIISCPNCGVVYFADKNSLIVHIKQNDSIHCDDFLSIGLRSANKQALYEEMIEDFTQILQDFEVKVTGLQISNTSVAEIGSGIGSLTASLAFRGNHVISIEPSKEDLQFQKDIQQTKSLNIEYYPCVEAAQSSENAHPGQAGFRLAGVRTSDKTSRDSARNQKYVSKC